MQLVNCSQRINQHADLEARLEKLEQKANDADSPSDEDPESTVRHRTNFREQGSQGRLPIP